MKKALKMNTNDNVATVLENVDTNEKIRVIDGQNKSLCVIEVNEMIPAGNKIALGDIEHGEYIVKYGYVIGKTTKKIKKARLVHVHNVKSQRVDIPLAIKEEVIKQMKIEIL